MAFLAPAAAAAGTGAATTALGAGLSAGTILGTGAASSGILGGLGLNALGGMTSILPASAGLTTAAPGIMGALPAAVAPTAGIFSAATPALAGLPSAVAPTAGIFANPAAAGFLGKSFAPLAAQTVSPLATAGTTAGLEAAKAGIIKNAMTQNAMQNAIMQNVAGGQAAQNLAGSALTSQLPGQAGNISNQMFDALSKQLTRPDLGQGFKNLGQFAGKATEVPTTTGADFFSKAAGQVPGTPEADALIQQAKAGEAYTNMAANQARVAADAARSQKLAIEAGLESPIIKGENFLTNFGNLIKNPSMDAAGDYFKEHPGPSLAAGYGLYKAMQPRYKAPEEDKGMIRPYEFAYNPNTEAYAVSPTADSREQVYFNPVFTPREPTRAAEGGIMALAVGGPVEQMAAMNAVGANTGYPMAQLQTPLYSNPAVQRPEAVNVISPSAEPAVGMYSGEQKFAEGGGTRTKEKTTEPPYAYTYDPKTLQFTQTAGPGGTRSTGGIGALVGGQGAAPVATSAAYPALSIPAYQTPEQQLGLADFYAMMDRRLGAMGGYAEGGNVYDLGSYSDGGRLLRGPGDGVSDSIPAVIGNKQPARLADGEFVIPARIVSELGNGSTEAGARKLYAMMDRVQKARRKTVGKNKVAANTRADKHLPA